ncbi:MAG: hypothetical protein WBF17_26855 [Phycisphaerae bacterium]
MIPRKPHPNEKHGKQLTSPTTIEAIARPFRGFFRAHGATTGGGAGGAAAAGGGVAIPGTVSAAPQAGQVTLCPAAESSQSVTRPQWHET